MKKSLCATFSILLLCSFVAICCLTCLDSGSLAYAESDNNNYTFEVGSRYVTLRTLYNANGKPYGVYMNENFFGDSYIPVEVAIYSSQDSYSANYVPSSDDFIIDFAIGADDSQLTAQQRSNRHVLIQLFTEIATFVDYVDSLANSQSAGLNGQTPTDVYRYNNASDSDDKTVAVDGGYKIEIAKETYDMLTIAQEMYEVTKGAFNPAVYRLVDLWGFSSRIWSYGQFGLAYDRSVNSDYAYPLPEQKFVDAFSQPSFIDFSQSAVQLSQEEGKYFVTKKVAPVTVDGVIYQQWIDLGGIAKGYVADILKSKLYEAGLERFYVNAGSSSIAFGLNSDGGNTSLGISNAFGGKSVMELSVGKSSVSTSGQNLRKYTVDGVEYSHIIDGSAGAPAQTGVKSVTIVVPAGKDAQDMWATRGDCLTTALTVLGYNDIFEVMGDYLEQNGIKVVAQYETLNGGKQLLSTFDTDEMTVNDDIVGEFKWDARGFYYADFLSKTFDYTSVLITLGCVFGAVAVALVVYHFVRGKQGVERKIQHAKNDKPFKLLDILVYVCVALVILVLFYVFLFDAESSAMQYVNVIDDQTGETLFTYNFVRNEYGFYDSDNGWTVVKASKYDNLTYEAPNGWTVAVSTTDDGIEVTFTRQINNEQHYNTMKIVNSGTFSVDMIDSVCGYHKECVRNFDPLENAGDVIVCSPNRLKVVAE